MPLILYHIVCLFFCIDTSLKSFQEETIYTVSDVSTKPQPANGLDSFQKKWSSKVTYPDQALRENIEGMVFIEFIVEKDGSIRAASVKQGIGYGCDEAALEAFRELTKMPWKPGIRKDQPVKVKMVLPFYFRIIKMQR